MNQFMIEAYAAQHDGRTRRRYAMGATPKDAARTFYAKHPDWIIRNMWEFVPPWSYMAPSTRDSGDQNDTPPTDQEDT